MATYNHSSQSWNWSTKVLMLFPCNSVNMYWIIHRPEDLASPMVQIINNGSNNYYNIKNMARTIYGSGNNIRQVVYASTTTQVINNTTSWADTGLSATITPQATSSKILVIQAIPVRWGSNNNSYIILQMLRGATNIWNGTVGSSVSNYDVRWGYDQMTMVDSPASTASLTYKSQFRVLTSAGQYSDQTFCPTGLANFAYLVLMEISGG